MGLGHRLDRHAAPRGAPSVGETKMVSRIFFPGIVSAFGAVYSLGAWLSFLFYYSVAGTRHSHPRAIAYRARAMLPALLLSQGMLAGLALRAPARTDPSALLWSFGTCSLWVSAYFALRFG